MKPCVAPVLDFDPPDSLHYVRRHLGGFQRLDVCRRPLDDLGLAPLVPFVIFSLRLAVFLSVIG